MKPREGISVDPAQVPTDLKEPAMDAGWPADPVYLPVSEAEK